MRPVAVRRQSVYVVVTPTGKRSGAVAMIPSPRVVRISVRPRARMASDSSGATPADHVEHRLADAIASSTPSRCSGHRIRVQQPAVGVDREDAAANVAQDVGGLEAGLLRAPPPTDPSPSPLSRSCAAQVTNCQCDERDDAELQPDGGLRELDAACDAGTQETTTSAK